MLEIGTEEKEDGEQIMNVVLEEKAAAKQREDQEGLEPVSRKKSPKILQL